MRYWRVFVKSDDGRQFYAKAVEISANRAILRGDHALPAGVVCELQIIVPPRGEKTPATVATLRAEVSGVVFVSGDIRLNFRVNSLSDEARQLIDSQKTGS